MRGGLATRRLGRRSPLRSAAVAGALLCAALRVVSPWRPSDLPAAAFASHASASSPRVAVVAAQAVATWPQRLSRRAVAAASASAPERYQFQTEVGKVMDIIVNSLYSNRDVFLRELVSNAADACDKKRFLALMDQSALLEQLKIRIKTEKVAGTLTVEDNGVGMTKEDLIENLGRIARSGTANFMQNVKDGTADLNLIGQFGVGFYSAFLVADRVEVVSSTFKDSAAGRMTWRWTSSGDSFTIEEAPEEELFGQDSGTKLILHLKQDAQEYLESGRVAQLLSKYSEFITFPIELWTERTEYEQVLDTSAPPPAPGEPPKMNPEPRTVAAWEVVNKVKPIWLRTPDTVKDAEYTEFYRTTFKAWDEPLTTTHFKVEGQVEFRALMFIPSTVPFELSRDMFSPRGRSMRLYVKRVFINDKFDDLVPRWLGFLRGVVDSEDLPLNVGREILQQSRTLSIIRKRVVRKVLDSINDLSEKAPDKFEQLWNQYGKYFKVGMIEDTDHKDELTKFVRFLSSASEDKTTSLPGYVSRMKPGQKHIYFVTGEGRRVAEIAPSMEAMKQKGYEVLYMVDPLEEMCAATIGDFEGLKFVDINKAGLEIDKTEAEKKELEEVAKDYEPMATWLKGKLGERVQKVQVSGRLVDSMATLVQGEWGLSPMMQRYMQAQAAAAASDGGFSAASRNHAILEINPKHPVIAKLRGAMESAPDAKSTQDMVMMVYETAALIGGYQIEDLGDFARRVSQLMSGERGQKPP